MLSGMIPKHEMVEVHDTTAGKVHVRSRDHVTAASIIVAVVNVVC